MTRPPRPGLPRSERELVERVARHLTDQGYHAYIDLDGTSYFDLIVRRGEEVGLVEAKLGQGRALLAQALRRRPWGNWVAVVLPSLRIAERLVRETTGRRAEPVGVWWLDGETVRTVRAARAFPARGEGEDPYDAVRAQLRLALDRVDRGETPEGLRWDGVLSEVRRASGGRGFAEWRLDEGT
jgi:hypothetical protein